MLITVSVMTIVFLIKIDIFINFINKEFLTVKIHNYIFFISTI